AEMFARSTGIELTRIPYKGNGQAIGDLIGGHVSMMVLSLSTILGNVKTGKLFALAVTTPDRSKLLPEVPTIAESAVPGFSAPSWLWSGGPRRYAGGHRRAAVGRTACCGDVGGGARANAERRRPADGQHASGVCRGDRFRRAKMVGVGQEPQFEDGVTGVPAI